MSSRTLKGLAVFSAVAVGTMIAAAPASAAFGDITCYQTKWPHLEINAKAPGNLRWVNKASATQTTLVTFLGGYSMNYGPWQKVTWTATNNGAGFYSTNGYCY